MLPLPILMTSLSPTMGSLAARIGPRIPLTVGPLIVAVGMLLALLMDPEQQLLDGAFPDDPGHGARHDDRRRAADRLGAWFGRGAACRDGVGLQQRGRADRRPDRYRAARLSPWSAKARRFLDGFHMRNVRLGCRRGCGSLVALTMLGGVKMRKA